jgi:hypothetical protein
VALPPILKKELERIAELVNENNKEGRFARQGEKLLPLPKEPEPIRIECWWQDPLLALGSSKSRVRVALAAPNPGDGATERDVPNPFAPCPFQLPRAFQVQDDDSAHPPTYRAAKELDHH